MHAYQREFLDFAVAAGVLSFGEFTLKSGRKSPYFFNTGRIDDGAHLAKLGGYYAAAIRDAGLDFDMLYGPAYKGIPLVCTTAIALDNSTNPNARRSSTPYAFNRKEPKGHGDGGVVVGHPLAGRVLIVDDVVSAGTALRESVNIIRDHGAMPTGLVIALDRQERGAGDRTAVEEARNEHGLQVASIVTLDHLIEFLETRNDGENVASIRAYRKRYGNIDET